MRRTLGDRVEAVVDAALVVLDLAGGALLRLIGGGLLGLGFGEATPLPNAPCAVIGAIAGGVGMPTLMWFAAKEGDDH